MAIRVREHRRRHCELRARLDGLHGECTGVGDDEHDNGWRRRPSKGNGDRTNFHETASGVRCRLSAAESDFAKCGNLLPRGLG